MQAIFDRWAQRRSGAIPPELIARIAPTRTEGINMRGIFRFRIEQYAEQLLPSRVPPSRCVRKAITVESDYNDWSSSRPASWIGAAGLRVRVRTLCPS
jgi:hypothetical protein